MRFKLYSLFLCCLILISIECLWTKYYDEVYDINIKISELPLPTKIIKPIKSNKVKYKTFKSIIYYYTTDRSETDGNPCNTASGFNICPFKDGVVANNCLKFGTIIEIDKKMYTVRDRMSKKYGCNVYDILVKNKKDAINGGKKIKEVKIYE